MCVCVRCNNTKIRNRRTLKMYALREPMIKIDYDTSIRRTTSNKTGKKWVSLDQELAMPPTCKFQHFISG